MESTSSSNQMNDIPIFTEGFLEHNKAQEAELRKLRTAISENEEQTALLTKYIENMKTAVKKLEDELNQEKASNQKLKNYLSLLRSTIITEFEVPPNSQTNLEDYLQKLVANMRKNKGNREMQVLQEKVSNVLLKMNS